MVENGFEPIIKHGIFVWYSLVMVKHTHEICYTAVMFVSNRIYSWCFYYKAAKNADLNSVFTWDAKLL